MRMIPRNVFETCGEYIQRINIGNESNHCFKHLCSDGHVFSSNPCFWFPPLRHRAPHDPWIVFHSSVIKRAAKHSRLKANLHVYHILGRCTWNIAISFMCIIVMNRPSYAACYHCKKQPCETIMEQSLIIPKALVICDCFTWLLRKYVYQPGNVSRPTYMYMYMYAYLNSTSEWNESSCMLQESYANALTFVLWD